MTITSSRSNRAMAGYEEQSNTHTGFKLKHGVGVFMAAILAAQVGFAAEATSQLKPKIFNGTDTFTQTTPWMVAIHDEYGHQCGGTLIAKDWVLTAAHCFYDETMKPLSKNNFTVVVKNSRRDFVDGEMKTEEDPIEEIVVEEIIPHPDFNYSREILPNNDFKLTPSKFNNDIALIKLREPSTVTPLELFPLHYKWTGDLDADPMTLGWGASNTDEDGGAISPDSLQKVNLPIVSNDLCKLTFRDPITDNMLCVGYQDGNPSTCPGDSGGPLVILDKKLETWRQVGLTSFGVDKPCGELSYSVFTRVENYRKLIAEQICTGDAVPAKPVVSKFINGNSLRLSWQKPDEDTQYLLTYTDNTKPTESDIEEELYGQNEVLVGFLPQGSNYTGKITAYKGLCTAESDPIDVIIE